MREFVRGIDDTPRAQVKRLAAASSSAMMGAFLGARIVVTALILCTASFRAEGKIYTVPSL